MGHLNRNRLMILTACLLLTGVAVHGPSVRAGKEPGRKGLQDALSAIPGWRYAASVPLSPEVEEALDLDDYAYLTYVRGKDVVTLYVGFYQSARKVGAAHHPLVCFSGQGWYLSDSEPQRVEAGGRDVSFKTLTASNESDRILLAYWFQAHDRTSASPFSQKVLLALEKVLHGQENNAFVRISMPLGQNPPEESEKVLLEFIQDFYPVFLGYLKGESSNRMARK